MKLTIEFYGLCAFVRPAAPQAPLHVVCVNGSHPGHGGHPVVTVARHDPWLAADLRQMDTDIEPRSVAMVQGRRFGLWDLTGYDITLESRGADLGSSPKLPVEAPKAAVMKDITGDGRIESAYTANHQGRPAPFATRISLMGGSVRYLPATGWSPEIPWVFRPALPGRAAHAQELTNALAYDLHAPSGEVDLVLQSAGNRGQQRLRLSSTDDCLVSISNLPFAQDPLATGPVKAANHFVAFYGMLLEKPTGVNAFPIPTIPPMPGDDEPGLAHGSFCPPALFEA